jgi:cysteine desulfurase / selenocysteine lyase
MRSEIITADFTEYKRDFPMLRTTNRGKPLVYLDSASSAQKPQQVIDAISHFYQHDYANIHRGIYEVSARASNLYEAARATVASFIHADTDEIVLTTGTTGAINLVAQSYGRTFWQAGDEVIISELEHHSNIVPWLQLQEQIGIVVKVIPMLDDGTLDLITYQQLLSTRTRLVAVTHVSNVIGTINPVAEITRMAHAHNALVLIDGAQAVPHLPVNVKSLNCDFYVFSAHKLYGPTGIGALYAKRDLLNKMPPYQGGGGMISTVSFNEVTYAPSPQKFEAGTPDIAAVIGFAAAIQYVNKIGMTTIMQHEAQLMAEAESELNAIEGLRVIGNQPQKTGALSFVIDNIHPHDIGTVLDHEGIAIRAGHHCAMPLMERLQVPATVRVSFGIYNDSHDIAALVAAIHLTKRLFA